LEYKGQIIEYKIFLITEPGLRFHHLTENSEVR